MYAHALLWPQRERGARSSLASAGGCDLVATAVEGEVFLVWKGGISSWSSANQGKSSKPLHPVINVVIKRKPYSLPREGQRCSHHHRLRESWRPCPESPSVVSQISCGVDLLGAVALTGTACHLRMRRRLKAVSRNSAPTVSTWERTDWLVSSRLRREVVRRRVVVGREEELGGPHRHTPGLWLKLPHYGRCRVSLLGGIPREMPDVAVPKVKAFSLVVNDGGARHNRSSFIFYEAHTTHITVTRGSTTRGLNSPTHLP